ncbi:hypothetical protein Tco_0134751 [Tanacetum coccineum]
MVSCSESVMVRFWMGFVSLEVDMGTYLRVEEYEGFGWCVLISGGLLFVAMLLRDGKALWLLAVVKALINTSFWKDKWHNEGVLKDVFPRLYALERHQNVTIHTKLIDYSLVNSFRRNPRSGVEEFQLDNLSRLVSTITLSSAVDRYVWSLENSGEFSVKSIRQVIDANCFPVIHSASEMG